MSGYTPDFEDFWKAYPRKEKKGDAFKAYQKAKTPLDDLLAGVERYKRCEKVAKGFVMLPATWLNSRSWEDEEGGLDGF